MEVLESNLNDNTNQMLEYIKALKDLESELQKKEYELSTINNCFYADKKEQVYANKLCQLFRQLNNLICIEFNTI